MKDDEALDKYADICVNNMRSRGYTCKEPGSMWDKEYLKAHRGECPACVKAKLPPGAAANAMDAVAAAAPIQNSAVPITPARVGYSTYTEWARKVSQEFQVASDRAAQSGDGGMAAYFLLRKQIHDAEVSEQKSKYNGL